MLLALFAAAAGYATQRTGLLPRWAAWVAYATAVLNFAAIPLGFSLALITVPVWAIIASFAFAFPIPVAIASISLIVRQAIVAPTQTTRVASAQRVQFGATV